MKFKRSQPNKLRFLEKLLKHDAEFSVGRAISKAAEVVASVVVDLDYQNFAMFCVLIIGASLAFLLKC